MPTKDLQDALLEEMRDMLSAEKQITKALRKMARKASHDELREGFEEHLEQTEGQIERLERAFETLEQKPRSKRCEAMQGILEEGEHVMEQAEKGDVLDAMMIAAAQKVEHYEIASYGTMRTWAKMLGFKEAERLFRETLDEEKQTDIKLTKMASKINQQAQPA
jgi:ferritin-like metal-binding protein YciE